MTPGEPPQRQTLGARIYRYLLTFFGPAQLGPYDDAPTSQASEPRCPRCGQPMSAHTYVETPARRRLRCPDAMSDQGAPPVPDQG
jgi:hypothetical protein